MYAGRIEGVWGEIGVSTWRIKGVLGEIGVSMGRDRGVSLGRKKVYRISRREFRGSKFAKLIDGGISHGPN